MGTLLYDADCGFCTLCARWLSHRARGLTVVPLRPGVPGVDPVRARREVPHLDGDGRVTWGADAIGHALRGCAWPLPLAGRVILARPVRPLARTVYAVVARNRHRLPGSTSACRLPAGPP